MEGEKSGVLKIRALLRKISALQKNRKINLPSYLKLKKAKIRLYHVLCEEKVTPLKCLVTGGVTHLLSLWGQRNSLVLLAQTEATFVFEEGRNWIKVSFESGFESCVYLIGMLFLSGVQALRDQK